MRVPTLLWQAAGTQAAGLAQAQWLLAAPHKRPQQEQEEGWIVMGASEGPQAKDEMLLLCTSCGDDFARRRRNPQKK